MRIAVSCLTLLCSLPSILANVEKTVFLTPASISIPRDHPNLDDLQLAVLTPARWRLQHQIAASFPTASTNFRGTETWMLLEGLEEQRRYEVRICWPATVSNLDPQKPRPLFIPKVDSPEMKDKL